MQRYELAHSVADSSCSSSTGNMSRSKDLVQHPVLAAAVARDPHEPQREWAERLVQGLPRGSLI